MRWLAAALGLTLAVRLLTLGSYPLRDTTEARYGEIVRIMQVSGNWVTPQETIGTPFWAKPPLYAWLGTASVELLGVDELALRLPSFLCGLAVLLLCWRWSTALARRGASPPGVHDSPDPLAPLVSCLVLATSVLFFVGFGSVMTDPSLCLCTAWMTVAFHRAVIDGSPRAAWRYGFFVAAGLAMLAKGPVAMLYTGLPIVLWIAWRGRLRQAWQALPWVAGTALAAAICLPWYLWAEARTPGFLNYFLVGEHLMRYLHPGWSGDRYGNAHREPIGTIWLCLVEALGLWSIAGVALLRPARGWIAGGRAWLQDDGRLLAALSAFVPLLVFTFARNLIWTYAMPSLLPVAVLMGPELSRRWVQPGRWRPALTILAAASVALLVVGAIAWAPRLAGGNSYAAPVVAWQQRAAARPGPLLFWGARTPASLRFYSRGQAQAAPDLPARLQLLQAGGRVYVALDADSLPALRQLTYTSPGVLDLQVVGQVRHSLIAQIDRR
jgi:4-amino-4-deoxy-L-arabinose transferase-like glycosyltransferase